MKKQLLSLLLAGVCAVSCNNANTENPLLSEWNTPFGIPPFEQVKPEHYMPAYLEAMRQEKAEIEAIVNNQIINKYRGDGIVISTATGSTAYNLSLGGPILSPTCNNIIVTPIACHSLISRSIILNNDENIIINILKSRKTQEKEAILTVDGRRNIDLHNNDSIFVKQSIKKVKFIKLNSNFFDLCNKKLKDNF